MVGGGRVTGKQGRRRRHSFSLQHLILLLLFVLDGLGVPSLLVLRAFEAPEMAKDANNPTCVRCVGEDYLNRTACAMCAVVL